MKNMTLSLPDDVARWTRVWAAEHDMSVSKMLSTVLEQRMRASGHYEQAMTSFLKRKPACLKRQGSYPTREAVHEG